MNIVENALLESLQFDYSECRSPSRARRRYRRGIVGRVKATMKPFAMRIGDTLYMHPLIADEFRRHVAEKAVDATLDFLRGMVPPGGVAPLGGYASGGVVKGGKSFVVGEFGRDFIMPLRKGTIFDGGAQS